MNATLETEKRKEAGVATATVRVVFGKNTSNVSLNGHNEHTVGAVVREAGGDPSARGTFSVNEQQAGLGTPVQSGDTVVFTPKTSNG